MANLRVEDALSVQRERDVRERDARRMQMAYASVYRFRISDVDERLGEHLFTQDGLAPRTEPDRKLIPRLGVALADEEKTETALAKEAAALLGYNVLRHKLKIPGKLGEVLARLDIEPLEFEAVEKYKADMVLWRKKEISNRYDPGFLRMHHIEVYWDRVALGSCKEEVPLYALRKAVQVKKACPEAIFEVDELREEKKLIDPFLVARLDDETYYLEVWKEPKFEETL